MNQILAEVLASFGWQERFEPLERIGQGGMGQVWRAREAGSGRAVALKILSPAREEDGLALARFEVEAGALTRLCEAGRHEGVVPIHDFKASQTHACLVMDFIPGLNLRHWCSTHQLSLRERAGLIAQVARAAGWFHGLGVVHRDLKPANILVSAVTRQPVIVDFSIAKMEDSLTLTLTNEALGTAPYMAPEQFDRRRAPVTPATDVHALGATLYELLTQVPPHPGEFAVIVQRHHDEVRPAPPSVLNPAVSRDLECVILKALSHRPADRYAGGTALAEDLDRFLAGEPVKARPLPLVTRLVRRARKKPALTAAIAACLALAAVAWWSIARVGQEQQRRRLEARLTTMLRQQEWSREQLQEAEAGLAALALLSPASTGRHAESLREDVAHDITATLRQPYLKENQWAWMREAADWLRRHDAAEADRLEGLLISRQGAWNTVAELRAPFASLSEFFPRTGVRVSAAEGLLYPEYDDALGYSPAVVVTDSLRCPAEVSVTFSAPAETFQHLGMGIHFQDSRVDAAFYKASHAPKSVIKTLAVKNLDPQSHILFVAHNKTFQGACHIPDTHLLDKPFTLVLRVEQNRAEASINGGYTVPVEAIFTLSSAVSANWCRISWPKTLGVREIILRHRAQGVVSPLEEADLLASQGRWQEARRRYEALTGDPQTGVEARYKLAAVHLRLQAYDEAAELWQGIVSGPPSRWSELSTFHLWMRTAQLRGLNAAAPYLAALPEKPPPHVLLGYDAGMKESLEKAYRSLGADTGLLNSDPQALAAAAKALRLLGTSDTEIANRFAFSFHQARLDRGARELLMSGLRDPVKNAQDAQEHLAALNSLALWCRITPSEKEPVLAERLAFWLNKLPSEPTVFCLVKLEAARCALRAGDASAAAGPAAEALRQTKADARLLTSAALVKGMTLRLLRDEAKAQDTWRDALEKAAAITQRSPLHLCDRIILHSLTRTWDAATAHEVLTDLISRNVSGQARTERQGQFLNSFLADPAFITTLNELFHDEHGRQLAEDYALCRDLPRDLHRRFYQLMFESYFLRTAFPAATADDTRRVRQTVEQLLQEMTSPRADSAHLFACIRAWNDPATAETLFDTALPHPPALVEEMRWLLQQCHSPQPRPPDRGAAAGAGR